MNPAPPGSEQWLALVTEDVIDPGRAIIDPHHHLWPQGDSIPYGADELADDVADGHNVIGTVFMECGASYDRSAPPHLAPVGETTFVASASALRTPPLIIAMVGKADLRRDDLDEILDAHIVAGGGLFRGVRDALAHATHPEHLSIAGRAPAHLHEDAAFRRGLTRLGERGLTYDSWHYHYQNREFLELARSVPGTTMVLDHFGTPLGVGPWAGQHDDIFESWKRDIEDIAQCPNVVAKLGGLAMPDNGFGWNVADRPPTSDEFVAAQRRWYLHTIESFGPHRCMFESNFPVDRRSLSYRTLWNGLKKIAAPFTEDEQDSMFRGTAARVYSLA
jgi:L-fuconolactonase